MSWAITSWALMSRARLDIQPYVQSCLFQGHAQAVSYVPPWAHYLGGYQDRLLGGPLGLPGMCRMAPDGVRRKDYGGEVLG
jgi:hypothetical protein